MDEGIESMFLNPDSVLKTIIKLGSPKQQLPLVKVEGGGEEKV